MSHKPLVSIIITTFNRVDMIGRCIDSVINQEYENVEIIVVDDCSNDNTEEFLDKNYKDKIKYIRHDFNLGVQFASNTGFKYAKGKYIAFIGDDDVWIDKKKLTEQVKIFENDTTKKYGIVTTDFIYITKNKTFRKNVKKPKNLVKHILRANGIISGSAALLRSDIFKQAGMFSKELTKGTDSDVYRRIILLGYDVYFIKKPMIEAYINSDKQMTSNDEQGLNRSIQSQLFKLNKYNEFYRIYPSSRSYVLFYIGLKYFEKYNLNNSTSSRNLSKSFFIKSLFYNLLNFYSWGFLFKLFFKLK